MQAISFPDALNQTDFLAKYWQRKPLYMPNAWPEFDNPLSADELAGLALEDEIPSRIIEQHSNHQWSVRNGPFTQQDFADLEGKRWSLLITDIEKHLPELMAYVQPFRFIPDWRFDDFMISYAPPGGSVGPHMDDYDVFLIQAQGQRDWQIEGEFRALPIPEEELIPNTDLRLINAFNTAQQFSCTPGDMLYLPPRIGHYGIAKTDCMTWSMGFKAPNFDEMLAEYMDAFSTQNEFKRYTDKKLLAQNNGGEITPHNLKALKNWFTKQIIEEDEIFSRWLGKFLSRDMDADAVLQVASETANQKDELISNSLLIEPNPFMCFNFIRLNGQTYLYVAGEEYQLSESLAKLLTQKNKIRVTLTDNQDAAVIKILLNKGCIYLC